MLSPDWNTNFIFPLLRKEDWEGRGRGLSSNTRKESRSVIREKGRSPTSKFRRFYFIVLIIYFSWQVGKLKTCLPRNESLEFFSSSSSSFFSLVLIKLLPRFVSFIERLKKYRGSLKSNVKIAISSYRRGTNVFLLINRILRLDYSLYWDRTWRIFLSRLCENLSTLYWVKNQIS